MSIKPGKIYSGASGIVLPVPNKLLFPPEFQDKTRLTYYGSLFNSIDVNSSFYKLPIASTLRKWSESVPEDFRFTLKLWKEITHNKGLVFDVEKVSVFLDRLNGIGEKKGCLLIQFPPSLSINSSRQLESLLASIQQADPGNSWERAIEFRNRDWYQDDIYELTENYKASIVIQDLPASATPLPDTMADFVYVRFHGPNGGYRGSYPDDFLYEYAQYITDWSLEGKDVYVYFNNTMGAAVKNLMTLNGFLSEPSA